MTWWDVGLLAYALIIVCALTVFLVDVIRHFRWQHGRRGRNGLIGRSD